LIGAYRDTELNLDLGRPLGDLLPALSRDIAYELLPLRGLTNAEVAEYIADAGHGLTAELANAVHAETLGNPVYVGGLVRHLLDHGFETGRVTERHAGAATSDFRALGVPQGVRQVLRSRLARLSLATRQLLDVASAFTAAVNFSVLHASSALAY